MLFSRDKKTAAEDFAEVFGSAERQLKDSGYRMSLPQAQHKYQLDYRSGALKIGESEGFTFRAPSHSAPSHSAPIHIPSVPDHRSSSYDDDHNQPSDDSSTLDTLGEFFVRMHH